MTELVNQLVKEMKEIEPKYVAIKIPDWDFQETEKLFCGNDKEKLKNKMFEHLIKELSLEEYLSAEKLKNYVNITFCRDYNRVKGGHLLLRRPDEFIERIDVPDLEFGGYIGIELIKNGLLFRVGYSTIFYIIIGR